MLSKELTNLFQIAEATAFIAEKLGRITTTDILFCATLTGQTQHANGILSKLAYLKIVCCGLPLTYPLCGSKHHPSIMPCCNVQFGQNYLQMHVHLTVYVITAHKCRIHLGFTTQLSLILGYMLIVLRNINPPVCWNKEAENLACI